MINYDKYAEIRDIKGMTDGKVAEKAGIGRSTFSDWKSGRSVPKLEKMQKIAEALEMEYSQFIGPLGKFSAYIQESPEIKSLKDTAKQLQQNVNQMTKPVPMLDGMNPLNQVKPQQIDDKDRELLRLFHNASEETQSNVMLILKNSQKDASKSSKEA